MRRLRLLLATRNSGKVHEIGLFLSGLDLELDSLVERADLPDAVESGQTFSENARLKAEHYARLTGLSVLAEDSGLAVEALAGRPGIHSARFATTDEERIARLLRLMEPYPSAVQRAARFMSALCLLQPHRVVELTGEVQGEIAHEPKGEHGFGYDPLFYYPLLHKTFAEMTSREKNGVSHRAQALRKLCEVLVS